MSCYINVYILIFTIKIYCVSANIGIVNHGVVPLHRGSVALQLYVELENKSKSKGCCVSSFKNRCCLGSKGKRNSYVVDAYGGDMTVLEPYERRQLMFVYPTLYQHDKVGVCDITLLYDCGDRFKKKRRAKLTFDTTVFNSHKKRTNRDILKDYYNEKKLKHCYSEDSNPLDQCSPANCDWKYDGLKPFFEKHSKRCFAAPPCVGDEVEGMPELVYVPKANKCRDVANPINVEDIYAMGTGAVYITPKTTTQPSPKVNLVKNLTTISQNLKFLRDMLYGRFQCADGSTINLYKESTQNAFHFILTYIGGITALILSVACLLNVCVFMLKRIPERKNWCCPDLVNKFKGNQSKTSETDVAENVKECLLRDIIVTDIPMELRESIVDICGRMGNNVRRKKRYRFEELGSQISLQGEDIEVYRGSDTSTTTICSCE